MKSRTVKHIIGRIGIYLAAIVVLLWTVLPILWMFISSITPTADLLTIDGKWFSQNINFDRYISIFSQTGDVTETGGLFINALKNSAIVSAITVLLGILFGGISAYAFARLRFRFKNTLLMATMFFQLLPSITLVIPLYVIAKNIGMIDKPIFLVVLYMSFILPYVIWVLNGYYKTIPSDLEQAAMIDGCNWFSAYWKIVLPLSTPGLVSVGALSFLMCWDEFMYALIFMTSLSSKTMPVAISEFSTRFGIDYGMVSTAGCIATVLPMVLAVVFQRYIVAGLTSGGVKD